MQSVVLQTSSLLRLPYDDGNDDGEYTTGWAKTQDCF